MYKMCYWDCPRSYIREKSRDLLKRINEHRRDFKSGNFCNTLVIHNIASNHTFDFKHSNIITFIHHKNKVRIIQQSAISHYKNIKQRPIFYKISSYWAKIMLKDFSLCKQRQLKRFFNQPSNWFHLSIIFSFPSCYFISPPFPLFFLSSLSLVFLLSFILYNRIFL